MCSPRLNPRSTSAMPPPAILTRNRLLAALPPDMLAHPRAQMTHVSLSHRQVLYAPEQPVEAIYFLEAGMVSLVADLEDGVQAEVGVIGREAMVGTPMPHGVETSFNEAFVQIPGT